MNAHINMPKINRTKKNRRPTTPYTTMTFDGHPVRVLHAGGQHWFAVRDMLQVFGIDPVARRSRVTSSVFNVDPRFVRTLSVQLDGVGNPRLITLNSAGLAQYFASRDGNAQTLQFLRWAYAVIAALDQAQHPTVEVAVPAAPQPVAAANSFGDARATLMRLLEERLGSAEAEHDRLIEAANVLSRQMFLDRNALVELGALV